MLLIILKNQNNSKLNNEFDKNMSVTKTTDDKEVFRGTHEIADIGITQSALDKAKEYIKLYELNVETGIIERLFLRISITGGGCSGFKYVINIDNEEQYNEDMDALIEINGLSLLVDGMSLNYIQGAYVDFISRDIAGGSFQVTNPVAVDTCSCGDSFSV